MEGQFFSFTLFGNNNKHFYHGFVLGLIAELGVEKRNKVKSIL
jgi:hypothetical protein